LGRSQSSLAPKPIMNLHPLDGAFERTRRAGEHLEELCARLETLRREREGEIIAQFQAQPPHSELVVPPSPQASMRIPILVGEICYNLRTALDYLIFKLAKLDSGHPQKKTQFPIDDDEDDFKRHAKSQLKGLNARHIAEIERLQPYKQCEWIKTLR